MVVSDVCLVCICACGCVRALVVNVLLYVCVYTGVSRVCLIVSYAR